MANKRDWNVVESKINLTKKNNKQLGKSREKVFTVLATSIILGIGMKEALDAYTNGSHDLGIDAVVIKGNKIHLFQMKCVDEFKKAKNKFPGLEIDKISSYLADLRGGEKQAFDKANSRIKNKTFEAMEVLKKANPKIIVHFVTNASGFSDAELTRANIKIEKHKTIKHEMHDLDWFANKFLKMQRLSIDRDIKIFGKEFFECTDKNLNSIVCTVLAQDIVELIKSKDDSSNVELNIFDQNVRVYLEPRNKTNQKIIDSAISEDNHMFWYQNNGITMTCDSYDRGASENSLTIPLTNVQIVNGGQTSISLFEAAKDDPEKIKDVSLLVRIIETGSEDIKISIAESTNSQTPITSRDLRANDREQRQLQDIFFDMGYFYERKKNEFKEKPKNKRIDALFSAQAYTAYFIGWPEVSKKDSGRIFDNLHGMIFTENLEAKHLLVSMQLFKLISVEKKIVMRKIRKKEPLDDGGIPLIEGTFHILFALRKILERDGLDIWNYEEGKKCIDEAIKIISEVYQDAEEDTNFLASRFFKDGQTNDLIDKKIKQSI